MNSRNRKADNKVPTNQKQHNNNTKGKLSQEEILLKEFAKGNKVSQLEAITELGIGHLSSVVSKMRLNYNIPVEKETLVSKSGARYMAYFMDKKEAKEWLNNFYGKALNGKRN